MNRKWTTAAAALGAGMAFIDTTALTVALPALREALGASDSALLWIHNAYAVPLAALLLIGGSLGDRYGIRRVFLTGVAMFGLASLACGFAPDANTLIALRILQGASAAIMIPGSLSMIARATPGHSLGRAVGLWSTFTLIATALGPVLGGLLAEQGLWRGVFFINVPLAAATILITLTRVESDAGHTASSRSLDWSGAILLALALGFFSYALIDQHLFLLPALLALGLFLLRQKRALQPLIPAGLFRSRPLVIATLISLLIYSAWGGFTYLLPTYLIDSLGFAPKTAGLLQLPTIVLLAAISPFAGKLLDSRGAGVPLAIGTFVSSLGFAALLWQGFDSHPLAILVPLSLLGVGLGFCAAPLSATIMHNVAEAHHGLAAGINSTAARIASACGVALLGGLALQQHEHDFSVVALGAGILCFLALPLALALMRKT